MSLPPDLQKIIEDHAKLCNYTAFIPKPAWKRYEATVHKVCMEYLSSGPENKKAYVRSIDEAKQELLAAIENKFSRLNELGMLLGWEAPTEEVKDVSEKPTVHTFKTERLTNDRPQRTPLSRIPSYTINKCSRRSKH